MGQSAEKTIELEVSTISRSREQTFWEKLRKGIQTPRYAIKLSAVTAPEQFMVLIVGEYEALQLAHTLEKRAASNPFLHDLLDEAYTRLGYQLEKILINSINGNGVFGSVMCYKHEVNSFQISARTSDSLIMAIKYSKPIYINEDIFGKYTLQANS
jgi:bifunctional DNase/RNase